MQAFPRAQRAEGPAQSQTGRQDLEEARIAAPRRKNRAAVTGSLAQTQVGGGQNSFIQGQPRRDCLAGWPSLGQATRREREFP